MCIAIGEAGWLFVGWLFTSFTSYWRSKLEPYLLLFQRTWKAIDRFRKFVWTGLHRPLIHWLENILLRFSKSFFTHHILPQTLLFIFVQIPCINDNKEWKSKRNQLRFMVRSWRPYTCISHCLFCLSFSVVACQTLI